jgi:hypothetical protein
VGPRDGLDDVEKRKFLTPLELDFRPLGRPARSQSLLVQHYSGFQSPNICLFCSFSIPLLASGLGMSRAAQSSCHFYSSTVTATKREFSETSVPYTKLHGVTSSCKNNQVFNGIESRPGKLMMLDCT